MKTAKRTTLQIGTISHATMRPEDLIPAFMDALAEVNPDAAQAFEQDPDNAEIWAWLENPDQDEPESVAFFLNEDLWQALDECCPPYCHFGSNEGDGSDYGVWPSIESMEEDARYGDLLKVNDTGDVPEDFTGDVMHVNDHGNVTLYAANAGTLTEVWSCV